jgi:cyanophycinase
MSHEMIVGGNPEAVVGTGFGLLPGYAIDTHFQSRHRLARLQGVVARYPRDTGLGIDEDTAVVVTAHVLTVLGPGEVRVCTAAAGREPARVQVLRTGDRFVPGDVARAPAAVAATAAAAP